jgi:hypothetical protein
MRLRPLIPLLLLLSSLLSCTDPDDDPPSPETRRGTFFFVKAMNCFDCGVKYAPCCRIHNCFNPNGYDDGCGAGLECSNEKTPICRPKGEAK